jgi:hypothetical protein
MSQLVKRIVQTWEGERIFAQKTFRSSKDPSVEYSTTIYWGGTMTNPNISCTCPTATFQRKPCHHAEELWNELSPVTKNDFVQHYEIVAKPWYRKTNQSSNG